MSNRNKTCYLCGESYKYCPTCFEDRFKPAYMSAFHDKNCSDIFDICTRYNMGELNKNEARDLLLKCDLSNRKNFKECIKRDLNIIFRDDERHNKGQKSRNKFYENSHEVVSNKK